MWFENSFRRHLLDMHIADWENDVFLSKFSPEEYYSNLKTANVKSAMIYFQSHVGYCYYPSKVGHMHSAFKERPDTLKHLVKLCREDGIDVIAYYSINYNMIERNRHPDWGAVPISGIQENEHLFSGARYGICCPNNPSYLQFVLEQVTEMLAYTEVDGIFFDMPFWPFPCYCKHCRKKYIDQFGTDIPTSQKDPDWKTYLYNREKWTDEYIGKITEHVKSINPDVSIYYNYAYAVLNELERFASETVNKHQDYASGDLYKGFLTQSFACKFYSAVTKNKPFEYMTGRCDPGLSRHTVTKSYDKLRLANMLTLAHHGANFVIDAIDPMGTMDKRFYKMLGQIYREVEKYEPYLKIGDMIGDVGLFYIMEGRGVSDNCWDCHYNATLTAAKTLIQNHIPYRIISQATADELQQYKAIIIANPNGLYDDTVKKLKKYVEQGGILYFSGGDQTELLSELLGATRIGSTDFTTTYIAPKPEYEEIFRDYNGAYPLAIETAMPIIKPMSETEVLATITLPYIHPTEKNAFASIHSNPPGTPTEYPAVMLRTLGTGKVIWSAGGIEAKTILCYQEILCNLLTLAGMREYSVKTTASRNTEIIVFADKKQVLVNLVYITDDEKTEIQRPFEVAVKSKEPKRVVRISDGSEIEFTYENGYVIFRTKELEVFDMYQIII